MKQRPKTSPIWKLPVQDLKILVDKSKTLGEITSFFGLQATSNNRTLKLRLSQEGIDFSKFSVENKKGKKVEIKNKPNLKDVLVKNST